jgi:hypothetical protein
MLAVNPQQEQGPRHGTSSLRIELAGALYHVLARGNERRAVFLGDLNAERGRFLGTLPETVDRFNWLCHVYCSITAVRLTFQRGKNSTSPSSSEK